MDESDRPVSARLAIAIFLAPGIFAWFTLREGYSATARGVSFTYAAFCVLVTLMILGAAGGAADKVSRDAQAELARSGPPINTSLSNSTQTAGQITSSLNTSSPIAQAEQTASQSIPATPAPQSNSGGKQIAAVSAVQLSTDYDANEVAAQMRWSPYTLEVTGIVTEIGLDMMDKPEIQFQGSAAYKEVHAAISAGYEQRASKVRKGSQITVRCESVGEIMGSPMLRNCIL